MLTFHFKRGNEFDVGRSRRAQPRMDKNSPCLGSLSAAPRGLLPYFDRSAYAEVIFSCSTMSGSEAAGQVNPFENQKLASIVYQTTGRCVRKAQQRFRQARRATLPTVSLGHRAPAHSTATARPKTLPSRPRATLAYTNSQSQPCHR